MRAGVIQQRPFEGDLEYSYVPIANEEWVGGDLDSRLRACETRVLTELDDRPVRAASPAGFDLLLLEAHGAVLQPEVGRLAFPAPLGVEWVAGPASETDLQEEPPLLGNLFLGGVCYWHERNPVT